MIVVCIDINIKNVLVLILAYLRHDLDHDVISFFLNLMICPPEFGINPLPLSTALPAHRLDLLHHTRPKLLDSHLWASRVKFEDDDTNNQSPPQINP